MRKHFFTFAVLLACLCLPVPALASILVSEVMYDPAGTDAGREWIEIWNDAAAPFDLGAALILEGGTRHKIAAVGSASSILPPGGYAILADKPESFLADYPSVGPVFDSAFSLSNSGERVALVAADGDEYSSAEWGTSTAAIDGKSWQRSGDAWVAAVATPAQRNADREEVAATASEVSGEAPASSGTAISAHSGTGGLTRVSRETSLAADAGRDRVVPVGSELAIEPEVSGATRASFTWSWGDGETSRGRHGRHRYRFPGSYAVVLNVRGAGGAVATSRATVVAVAADVSLTATPGEEGAVTVASRSSYELNLGGFRIEAGGDSFEFPPDTILFPGGRIDVPNAVTGLSAAGSDDVFLRRPDRRKT